LKIRGILSKDNTQLTCISYGFNLFKQTDYISVIYFIMNNMYMYVYMHNVYVVTWYMQNIMQK